MARSASPLSAICTSTAGSSNAGEYGRAIYRQIIARHHPPDGPLYPAPSTHTTEMNIPQPGQAESLQPKGRQTSERRTE